MGKRIIYPAENKNNILFLITHGERGEGINPPLTKNGIAQAQTLASIVKNELDKRGKSPLEIWHGEATRFEQMCMIVKLLWPGLIKKTISCILLGDQSTSITSGVRITGSGMTIHSFSENVRFYNLPIEVSDPWKFLCIPKPYSILLCGAPFMLSPDFCDSHSACLYRVDVKNKKIDFIFRCH